MFPCTEEGCDRVFETQMQLNGHRVGAHIHPHKTGEIKHGTRYGYLRCLKRPEGSCEECRAWNRTWHREARRRKSRSRW